MSLRMVWRVTSYEPTMPEISLRCCASKSRAGRLTVAFVTYQNWSRLRLAALPDGQRLAWAGGEPKAQARTLAPRTPS